MSDHAWESSEFTRLVGQYDELKGTADGIVAKAGESPNIMVYGLFSMGAVGWWMQLGQQSASGFTEQTARMLDATQQAIAATQAAYDGVDQTNAEKARSVEQIVNDLEKEIP